MKSLKKPIENEISLFEIIQHLINSKKLIIFITLFFALISYILSFQLVPKHKSTALIEIGHFELSNGKIDIIEESQDVIRDIKINLIYKNQDDGIKDKIKISPIEDKLIQIEAISASEKKNLIELNNFVNYLERKHSGMSQKLTQNTKELKLDEIRILENEIQYIENSNILQNNDRKSTISNEIEIIDSEIEYRLNQLIISNNQEIKNLKNKLPLLKEKSLVLNEIINEDTSNLELLKSNSELHINRAAQSPTLNQVISDYKMSLIDNDIQVKKALERINFLERELNLIQKNKFETTEIFELNQTKEQLNNSLNLSVYNRYSEEISEYRKSKQKLESQLLKLEGQKIVNTSLVGEIETQVIAVSKGLITLFGIFIGFMLSIFWLILNYFIRQNTPKE